MEFALRRSGQGDGVVKEEKRNESGGGDDHEALHQEQETTVVEVSPTNTTVRSIMETVPTASSTKKEEVDELESARAEMGEVREENQRLKMCLDRIMKEYEALQMQFHVIVQQETKESGDHNNHQEQTKESELVSLSLGRVPSHQKSEEKIKVSSSKSISLQEEEEFKEDDLALGLDCKFETSKSGSTTEANNLPNPSPTNSSEVPKEEAAESWPPSKVLKTANVRDSGDQDEVSQQNPAKKARVCVRARCDTATMNDGCQWRKYGQKISKGNPCPRAYYRCTVAPNCPVRKQVQRCAEDISILITTYEGTHNHPLPLSATAMASTTSAAASMLLSGSSSTSHHPAASIMASSTSTAATTTTASDLHGLNLYLSDGTGSKPRQFYLSNPALSPSPSHPTITLDLTTPNNIPSSSNRFTSNYIHTPPRFPSSTSLSFSSSEPNALSWSNNGFLTYNYNTTQGSQPYNNSNNNDNRNMNILSSSINLGRQLPIIPIPTPPAQAHQNSSLPDTIAAATKVITADPTFQSALAAALSSIIGTGSGGTSNSGAGISTQGVGENLGHVNKITNWGNLFPASAAAAAAAASTNSKVSGCASSFLNKTASSASTQTGSSSLMFLPPSLPFSSSKSASALSSPGENRDNSNS